MLLKVIALLLAFFAMEAVAYLAHRYIMHGFLWSLHRSHHQKSGGFFEKNDWYFLLFATPGVVLIITGVQNAFDWKFFAGMGIALYGFAYLLVHDVLIHRRLNLFAGFNSPYLRALRRAHKAHHAVVEKNAGVSYGMLWVSKKYFEPETRTDVPKRWRGNNIVF